MKIPAGSLAAAAQRERLARAESALAMRYAWLAVSGDGERVDGMRGEVSDASRPPCGPPGHAGRVPDPLAPGDLYRHTVSEQTR